jgi:hypothetical protein
VIKTKGKSKTSKAAPYVRRTLEDKRVHEHVRSAAASLRAALGIVRQPEPEPPKRYGRKIVFVVAALGVAGLVARKRMSKDSGPRDHSAERPAEPVEPARAAHAA